jgi:hypothetical protein
LNRQPHSEQPKPRKRCCSIHTSLRLMAVYVAAPQTLSDRSLEPRLLPGDEALSFRSGVLPDCTENRQPVRALAEDA